MELLLKENSQFFANYPTRKHGDRIAMKYGLILLLLCKLSSGNETQDIVPPEEGDPDLGQQPLPFGATDYYRLNTNSRAPYSFYGVTNTGNPFSVSDFDVYISRV